ncbi:MAG TPA: TMEM175 family protein [Jiangellaceae bacterium]|nr:TMEM175 family protein [Jiangellaceae bacterium]
MTDSGSTAEPRRRLSPRRLEAFSDGVFAIAITLLVLEISVPEGSEDDLLTAVLQQWPSYLAYVVSFATIGVTWLEHNAITDYMEYADAMVVRVNLLLLLLVSFLPFPTRLVAENIGNRDAERVAATIYGLNLLLIAVLMFVLWRYVVSEGHLRADIDDEEIAVATRRLTPGFAGYVGLLVLGLFFPTIAVIGYLGVALFLLIPFSAFRRRS